MTTNDSNLIIRCQGTDSMPCIWTAVESDPRVAREALAAHMLLDHGLRGVSPVDLAAWPDALLARAVDELDDDALVARVRAEQSIRTMLA